MAATPAEWSFAAIGWAVVAACGNVIGAVAITSRKRWSAEALTTMIAFSAGFMVSVALVDMVPEAIAHNGASAGWIILCGYLLVHLTQHTLARHFHFGEETHHVTHAVGVSALVGLLLHMFVDGVAVASGFDVGTSVGALVLTAIILHKLPEGSAISSLFLAAGFGRKQALAAGVALGVATILGAVFTETFAVLGEYGLALSAGVTIYVAASNLVHEFQQRRGWRVPAAFFAGCALYYLGHRALGA